MAVAKMPGDANQFAFVMRMDLQQFLCLGTDLHNAATFQRKSVAMTQPHRLR